MRFLPQLDPQSLDLSVLKLLSPQDADSPEPAPVERYPLLEDGMELIGRPVL
ncbi:MAG: hypothetical protein JXM73_26210 [Anaerolineae bacterium]|nr:hypothetical protein [Anaerolineae bacterium]